MSGVLDSLMYTTFDIILFFSVLLNFMPRLCIPPYFCCMLQSTNVWHGPQCACFFMNIIYYTSFVLLLFFFNSQGCLLGACYCIFDVLHLAGSAGTLSKVQATKVQALSDQKTHFWWLGGASVWQGPAQVILHSFSVCLSSASVTKLGIREEDFRREPRWATWVPQKTMWLTDMDKLFWTLPEFSFFSFPFRKQS